MKCARLQDAHSASVRCEADCVVSAATRNARRAIYRSRRWQPACLDWEPLSEIGRASIERSISAHAELRVRLRRSKRYYRRDKVLVCLGYGPLLTRGAASNLDEDERRRDRCNVVVRDTNLHHAFRQQANLLEVCLWRHSHRPDFVRDALQRASLAKNLLWRSLAVR